MGSPAVPDEDPAEAASGFRFPSYTRRLSDKVIIAFHQACDQGDLEVAQHLLRIVELILARRPVLPGHQRRRSMEGLIASHERLWYLKYKERVEEAASADAAWP